MRVLNINKEPYVIEDGRCMGNALMTGESNIEEAVTEELGQFDRTEGRADLSQPVSGQCSSSRSHPQSVGGVSAEYEHVGAMIDALPDSLTDRERQVAVELITRNGNVFSKSEYDLGRNKLVQHMIDVGDSAPFKEPLRRHPRAYLDIIDRQVEEMEKHDIIEKAASPWVSNVVLVRKKGTVDREGRQTETVRFCNDYRRLNSPASN